jgi:hypothetical protein
VLPNLKRIYGYKIYFEYLLLLLLLLLLVGSASSPCLGRQVDLIGSAHFNWDSESLQAYCDARFYLLYWNECYKYRISRVRRALKNTVFISMNKSSVKVYIMLISYI